MYRKRKINSRLRNLYFKNPFVACENENLILVLSVVVFFSLPHSCRVPSLSSLFPLHYIFISQSWCGSLKLAKWGALATLHPSGLGIFRRQPEAVIPIANPNIILNFPKYLITSPGPDPPLV